MNIDEDSETESDEGCHELDRYDIILEGDEEEIEADKLASEEN